MKKTLLLGCLLGLALFSCATKEAKAVATTDYKEEARKLHALLSAADVPPQRFEISSDKPSEITGKNGLFIRIDPFSLETESGKPLGDKIKVELRELVTPSDFIFQDARTQALNGKQIITSGSYFISMTSAGSKLRIRPGRALLVDFRRFSTKRMELFTAGRDSIQNLDWVPSNQRFKRMGVDDDELGNDEYYQPIAINRLGWMASSVFNRASSGAAAFDLKDGKDFSFGKAFLIIPGEGTNVAIESTMFFNGRDDMFFDKVPSQGTALFVAVALKKGKLHGFVQQLNLEALDMPMVEFKEMTANELFGQIQKRK